MSRVHSVDVVEPFDVESGKVPVDNAQKVAAVVLPAMSEFKDRLEEMCKVMIDLKEKLEGIEAETVETEETLWQRLQDNTLKDMFIGKDITSGDVDNVVNTLTLMNALILTIPYGIMSSAGYDYWDWVENTLAACPKTIYSVPQDFRQFGNAFNSVIYSTISVLLCAMAYYLLRPKADKKFRKWWKFARYVILIMLLGTSTSCVSLVACSTWMFSWYMIPTSKLCTYSAWGTGAAVTGVAVIAVTFMIALFLML
jgi:hypothetical protein